MNRKNFIKPLNLTPAGKLPKSLVSEDIVQEYESSKKSIDKINLIDIQPRRLEFEKQLDDLLNENLRLKNENKYLIEKVENFENTFEKEMEDRDSELNNLDSCIDSLKLEKKQLEKETRVLNAKVTELEEAVDLLKKANSNLSNSLEEATSGYWFTRYFYGSK
jgi:chromosome segregation ATPase